ncbi:fluoride efflux transporter CrcB [Flavihumibacter rivuli]|uniref:fluoride efflux transporter CrcB n=1 Tax=Flavihumibacter rivuli TaxID=2838156 RepID=UPI001BDF0F5A|nr:fluoride efflux transporter CrcB [Flavihumibacter rivuli]ULQ57371.1 fluoride efflux transporter CrcB [Flavihumibacter rivuli]
MLRNFLLVGLGGMTGSVLRYAFSLLFKGSTFPIATFTVNLAGSFAIGLVMAYFSRNSGTDQSLRLLLATGLCGGFTTFSTFSLENLQLLKDGQYSTALLYIAASLVVGIAATAFGFFFTKII